MKDNFIVNPKIYEYQTLHELKQSYFALTEPYPLNLNYLFDWTLLHIKTRWNIWHSVHEIFLQIYK